MSMDSTQFFDLSNSVFEHNFKVQKQLEKDGNILIISKLKDCVNRYPLADIYLHYPKDSEINDLPFCYSFGFDGATQLLPILSVYLSEEKIVLSYLSQEKLDSIDFSMKLPSREHYTNSKEVKKYLDNDNGVWNLRAQNHSMIFMEHIPDSLNWTYDCPEHKIFQSFSFGGISSLMLWDSFYFTPHY